MTLEFETRLVFKPSIAHRLLQSGYQIVGIRPQITKDGVKDYTRCVFEFRFIHGIDEAIEALASKKKDE